MPDADRPVGTPGHRTRREIGSYLACVAAADSETVHGLVAYLCRRRRFAGTESIRIEPVYRHAPRFEDDGWIEYDDRTETIVYRGHGSARSLLAWALELLGQQV